MPGFNNDALLEYGIYFFINISYTDCITPEKIPSTDCIVIIFEDLCLASEHIQNRIGQFFGNGRHQNIPNGLELDIFYPQYGFAIEVQGVQHEKYIEFFHNGDPNNFIKQQARDQLKKELCEENQIALRYVWYYEDPHIVIPEHLRESGLIE